MCRAAASEGGDDEDAGPDSAAGTSAQQQVGEREVKHPSQTHVNAVAELHLGLSVTWSSQLKPFLYTSPSLLFPPPLPSPPPGHLPLLH